MSPGRLPKLYYADQLNQTHYAFLSNTSTKLSGYGPGMGQNLKRILAKEQALSLGEPPISVFLVDYDPKTKTMKCGTLIGTNVYLKILRHQEEAIELLPVSAKDAEPLFRKHTPSITLKPFTLPANLPKFARTLAANQAKASTTTQNDSSPESLDRLIAANAFLMEQTLDGKPLTLEVLRKLNILAVSKNPEIANKMPPVYQGILRGENQLVGEAKHIVDLREADIGLGSVALASRPEKVAEELNVWIADANHVTAKTPPLEVFKLVRRFLLIHPFLGGNGRTTRILLDHLMIKAGYPPVPQETDPMKAFIFLDDEGMLKRLATAYGRR